jgi:2-polyprenyl-3-methyl-5-hydroxy-6-metoxy-1,4-benzoquinol methylase
MNKRLEKRLLEMSKTLSRKGLYEFLSNQYSTIRKGADVLSIGAGGEVNELLQEFAERTGFRVVTFDIDESRGPDVVGDICSYDFGGKRFDLVVASEVLEHLHSPHLGLENIRRILKRGGVLVLSTPFILPIHDRPHDYFRFTRYGLEFLLKDFHNVQIHERNSYFEAIDVLWARLFQTNGHSTRLLSYVIIPLVFYLKRPLTAFLGKLVRTDAMTTGYVVTAVR